MLYVTTPVVFPNVIGLPGRHGPHVTANVELAYSSGLGRLMYLDISQFLFKINVCLFDSFS